MKRLLLAICVVLMGMHVSSQSTDFSKISFLLGNWEGIGVGFGNDSSVIHSSFLLVMDGKFIEAKNESFFKPTDQKPEGEHHIDNGYISFDKGRGKFIYRQYHNEGFVNIYLLNDSLSTDKKLVFETEKIENFVPGGKAEIIFQKIDENTMQSTFNVGFPDRDWMCFGQNTFHRAED